MFQGWKMGTQTCVTACYHVKIEYWLQDWVLTVFFFCFMDCVDEGSKMGTQTFVTACNHVRGPVLSIGQQEEQTTVLLLRIWPSINHQLHSILLAARKSRERNYLLWSENQISQSENGLDYAFKAKLAQQENGESCMKSSASPALGLSLIKLAPFDQHIVIYNQLSFWPK